MKKIAGRICTRRPSTSAGRHQPRQLVDDSCPAHQRAMSAFASLRKASVFARRCGCYARTYALAGTGAEDWAPPRSRAISARACSTSGVLRPPARASSCTRSRAARRTCFSRRRLMFVAARADGRLPVLAVTDERVVLGLGDRAVLDLGHEDVVHELALAPARPADGHVEHHERGNSRRDDDQDTEVPEGPVRGAGVRPARARQGRCWLPWSTFKSFRIPVPRPSLRERRRSANFCSHELAPRRVPR